MARKKLSTLTEQMFYVLLILQDEKCGIEITELVSTLTHQRISLGPGTLYTILSQFEEENLIQETKVDGRKRYYKITSTGYMMLTNEYQRLQKMIYDANTLLPSTHN